MKTYRTINMPLKTISIILVVLTILLSFINTSIISYAAEYENNLKTNTVDLSEDDSLTETEPKIPTETVPNTDAIETTTETVTETITESEDITETETVTEPTPPSPTRIDISYTSKGKKTDLKNGDTRQVYRGAKYKFRLTVDNKVGKIKATSNKTKVASVTVKKNAIIANAKKAGTASITVNNNGMTFKFRIKVINPTLKNSSKTLNIKDTYTIKIKGQNGKKSFKSSNKKILTVTKSGKVKAVGSGDAKITVKTNGGYLLYFTVHVNGEFDSRVNRLVKSKKFIQRTTIYTKDITVWCNAYNYVGKIKTYLGYEDEAAGVNALFNQENNLLMLYEDKYGWESVVKNSDKLDKKEAQLNKADITSSNTKILKITKNGRIYGVAKGKAVITVKLRNKTFKVNANVIKPKTFHFKSNSVWQFDETYAKMDTTAKVVYNPRELYQYLKSACFESIIKGEKPKYQFVICYFKEWNSKKYKDNIKKIIDKYSLADFDDGTNFCSSYFFRYYNDTVEPDSDNTIPVEGQVFRKYNIVQIDCSELDLMKKAYNKAIKAIKDYNISGVPTAYDKIKLLSKWFRNNIKYGEVEKDKTNDIATNLILNGTGVCSDWCNATTYFCSLLNIPCFNACGKDHEYNIAKCDDGKWYILDILWGAFFVGTDEKLDNRDNHKIYEKYLNKYGLTLNDVSKETYYRYIEDYQSDEDEEEKTSEPEQDTRTSYSYNITPLLEPFNNYFFVKTDNPDPTSFRFVDESSVYGENATIEFDRYGANFADVNYENKETGRVNGGYIFCSSSANTDGGRLFLQLKSEEFSYYDDKWDDTDVEITIPQLMDEADYLIKTYATKLDFFDNMDAVQKGLSSICFYNGPTVRGKLEKTGNNWFMSLGRYIDQAFYIISPYTRINTGYLFISKIYPFKHDSISFPSLMAKISKRLNNNSSYKFSDTSHALIEVTLDGKTHNYGGQGSIQCKSITEKEIIRYFDFNNNDSVVLNDIYNVLLAYSKISIDDDISRQDALTWKSVCDAVGNGSWVQINAYPDKTDANYAYVYLYKKNDGTKFQADEYGAGNSIYWDGDLGYLKDTWIDGRYIGNWKAFVPGEKFEDHSNSNIYLNSVIIPQIKYNWQNNSIESIEEVEKDVLFVYDEENDVWKADRDAFEKGCASVGTITELVNKGKLDKKYLDEVILTREYVETLDLDYNTDVPPEQFCIFTENK